MRDFDYGTYIGPLKHLRGERALLQKRKRGVVAQFDTYGLARKPGGVASPALRTDLAHHWHRFSEADFSIVNQRTS